jgi:serine phosphatase RsbU (regulator of sigma subunit)
VYNHNWPSLQDEQPRTYSAGEHLFAEGDSGSKMYLVLEGEVELTVQGRHLETLGAGSIFGEMSLVEKRPRSATAVAATDCKLLILDYERLTKLVQEAPEFAIQTMATISSRLRRLMAEEVRRHRLDEELKVGRRIQLSLMPERCPQLPGWDVAAYYEPAREVGGDFYDFVVAPDQPRQLRLAIADVTGKGVPAALFMASARTTLRAESVAGHGPASVLSRANRIFLLDAASPLFLSAFYAVLDSETAVLTYANAGHDYPLWRYANGCLQPLNQHGLVLGLIPGTSYSESSITMAPGDSLVMYTDGVTEARDEAGALFGEERLAAVVTTAGSRSAGELVAAIVDTIAAFAGATPPADDCTIVVLKRTA